MNAILNPRLDHPAYHATVSLPKYNGPVNVLQAHCANDGARVLASANPEWTEADHLVLADLHATEAAKLTMQYSVLLDQAANETFGRNFLVSDYRVSAVGCSEFSEEKKVQLRHAAHSKTHHKTVAAAHLRAAVKLKRIK